MHEFVFHARDRGGAPVEGTIAAKNLALALARLRSQGLEVDRITPREEDASPTNLKSRSPGGGGSGRQSDPVWQPVRLMDLAVFYRQAAALLDAGMPLFQALAALHGQTRNPALKSILQEAQEITLAGGTLSEVMSRHPHVFSELQTEIVRVGELTGTLDRCLVRLAEYLERELNLRRLVKRLTLYPKLVLLAALFLLGRSFFHDGVPAISKLVVGAMGQRNYSMRDYFMDTVGVLLVLAAMALGAAVALRWSARSSEALRRSWEGLLYGLPALGGVARAFAVSRFARAFAALYQSGASLGTALDAAGRASGSLLVRGAVQRAIPRVEQGSGVADALVGAGVFPALFLNMIRTGEQTGNLDDMCERAASHLEQDAEARAYQYAHVFSTAVYLMVAIMVGYAVVRFYAAYAGAL